MEELSVLIERARSGDLDAFGKIVARFQDMAYGCSYAVLGDAHLAQDAAQEAFVEAYRSLPRLSEPAAFPGWFRRIVLGKCNRMTRQHELPEAPLEAAAHMASGAPDPAESVVNDELKQTVLDAIRSLPEGERMVTTLFYINGYSQQQIAEFMEISVPTVKNRLFRARKRVKGKTIGMVEDTLSKQRLSRDDKFKESVMNIVAGDRARQDFSVPEIFYTPAAVWFRERREMEDGRIEDSHYDWHASRVAVVDGEPAAVWSVYDLTMRIGSARVRAAGHNVCHTFPKFTGHGILEQTADTCLAGLAEAGYDLAVHQGDFEEIEDGGDLGFTPGWRELYWFVPVEDLSVAPFDGQLHEFRWLTDLAEIAKIYNRDNDTVTGTTVRPTFRKSKHPNHGHKSYYWTNARGEPVGYVFDIGEKPNAWLNRHTGLSYEGLMGIDETGGDPAQTLSVLTMLAGRCGADKLWFRRLPYQSWLGTYLRGLDRQPRFSSNPRGMRLEMTQGSMRYMVRIVNLRSLFEKLAAELTQRLQRSALSGFNGTLAIEYDDQQLTLGIEQGTIHVLDGHRDEHAIRGRHGLVQLVVGADEPADILARSDLRTSGAAAELARAMFPVQYPQMMNQAL